MLSVVGRHSCCYVAGPVTSSLEILLSPEVDGNSRESMVKANRQRMHEVVDHLRGKLSVPVIDPGLLIVDEWEPRDYGAFFLRVLEELSCEVRLMNGWQFSFGASKEVVHAAKLGLPCRSIDGEAVTVSHAVELLSGAVETLGARGMDRSRFVQRVAELHRLGE